MKTNTVYTVTVVDIYSDTVLGIRRTPAIFTTLHDAIFTVKNNLRDLSDGGTFQYAVIEESQLNIVRPNLEYVQRCWWYKFNSASGEFIQGGPPVPLKHQTGFGIG